MADTPLTYAIFALQVPAFAGLVDDELALAESEIAYANLVVQYCNFGLHSNRARSFHVAHFLSLLLELKEQAEEDGIGGGGNTTSDRVAHEKVGEVEVKFHKPASTGSSNEHNDPTTQQFSLTDYGKMYLAIRRSMGLNVATTGHAYIK